MMHNNLFVNRLIIYTKDNLIAYDEEFHHGINIIRGKNSSGKSTIIHFLFYALGGAFNEWVKEARECSKVLVEIEANGATLVLMRELNFDKDGKSNSQEPMYVFWGELNDLTAEKWKKFNFKTSLHSLSFSNVLFDALEIPIVKGESNITMHQLLRLLYIDQESPTSSLFLYEHFDTNLTRETVSDLLLGIYSQELYDKKIRKDEVEKELETTTQEIKAIRKYIDNPYLLIPSHIKTMIQSKETEIESVAQEVLKLKNEEKAVRFTQKTKLEFEVLNKEAVKQRESYSKLKEDTRNLEFDIEDSNEFIDELNNKLRAIRNSIATRDFFQGFNLEYCPECLSSLGKKIDKEHCHLCKQKTDESFGVTQARKIEQEIRFQLKESSNLLLKKERKLIDMKAALEVERHKVFQIQTKVNQSLKDVKSTTNERIDQLLVEKGMFEGEILQYKSFLEKAEIYQQLKDTESALLQEKESIEFIISHITKEQNKDRTKINNVVEKYGLSLLKKDLERQEEFTKATEFNIDYKNNIAFISDRNERYSSSSNFYLKTSARYAIFLASLDIAKMRFPRFIFCDNMEDKGIEPARAHNFQKVLVDMAAEHTINSYQLIYTTSHILKELDIPEYCVGEFYTETNKSLKNV